ncbi:MAG: RagB/SusD family nutrient uptake outer membrane protein [Bacteroidales bacterium]|nr:RagB/SusD family nutrient uptake outer membrane protein [Bacteroidales bacterium]
MKKIIYIILTLFFAALSHSCADLNLTPPSEASTENWNKTAEQLRISLNDLYRQYLWKMNTQWWGDKRSDDWSQRTTIYEYTQGNVTSTWSVNTYWENSYKGISRAVRVIEAIDAMDDAESFTALRAEAMFFRGYLYGRQIILYGDVPFYTKSITPEEALNMSRTDKNVIKTQVYADLDYAIANLPEDNSAGGVWRVNRYVALSLKARIALHLQDWAIARDACAEVMDSGVYSLYPDYGELFRIKGLNCEVIFSIANLYDKQYQEIKNYIPATAGGAAIAQPSWDLLATYECTDGKTIDESPLFNPHNPYENRDPRCCETFVAPGSTYLGVVYEPNPNVKQVWDDWTGQMVNNRDIKPANQYAAFSSTCLRKGGRDEWREGQYNDNPNIIIRYADVLLMYAEAKIELNEIDQSVLDAINDVRARAYKTTRGDTAHYPSITTTDQVSLRKILRRERRVEFAWENRRWFDLKRWGWFEKAYSHHRYGHKNAEGLVAMVAAGDYYWPYAPDFDEDGFPDFTRMYNEGYIERYVVNSYNPKVELFPIPNDEILTNSNLTQNPGY